MKRIDIRVEKSYEFYNCDSMTWCMYDVIVYFKARAMFRFKEEYL